MTSRTNKQAPPTVTERLLAYYLESDKTYAELAELIGGVSLYTVRRVIVGIARPNRRTAYKIERFLDRVSPNAA